MNKFLATLLAGLFTLTLGASAFAADAAKPVEPAKAVEPAKTDLVKAAEAKTEAPKAVKKHHHSKHAKKAS